MRRSRTKSHGARPKAPGKRISQITIRGLDETLALEIEELAEREDISFNKAALRLLRRGAGVAPPGKRPAIGDALDRFVGTWDEEEYQQLLTAIQPLGKVDEDFWK